MVEKTVFDDPSFREKLTDAVTSMHTGSAWDGGNIVGPMVTNNNDKMLHAIEKLEDSESWLVKPEFADQGERNEPARSGPGIGRAGAPAL